MSNILSVDYSESELEENTYENYEEEQPSKIFAQNEISIVVDTEYVSENNTLSGYVFDE